MKQLFADTMLVFALLIFPVAGCGGSSNGGNGGDGGSGGAAGSGGDSGSGGTAGSGGTGGMAGSGGTGGSSTATQSWTGQGTGDDGPFSICLTVNEDGSALVFDGDGECSWSFAIQFESCATTPDAWATAEDVPIEGGAFSFEKSFREVTGTFDGDTASGDVTVYSCTGSWTATPDL